MNNLFINLERLMETFKISNKVGQISETGVRRLALSTEDKIMRDIFVGWLEEEKLEVRVDDFGNIYGRRDGLRNDLAPVITGSHLDTQPYGGRYDGMLGVFSALEIIKVLNENNVQTLRPIEIVNFTNEEGRFDPPGSGSGGMSNSFTKEYIYKSNDNGYNFEDELKKIGYLGDEKNRPKEIHSYVELHIEQGPILEQENKSIGIIEGDKGFEMIEFNIKGKNGHSNATSMEERKDALVKAAEIIVAVQKILKEQEDSVINIGTFDIEPNSTGHIPSKAKFTMLISQEDKNIRDQLIEIIKKKSIALVKKDNMDIEINSILSSAYSLNRYSKGVVNKVEEITNNLGYSNLRMISSGGHDANNVLKIAPSGMIFIPCKNGISHSVEEFSSEEDIERGANVLLNTVINFAQQENNLK